MARNKIQNFLTGNLTKLQLMRFCVITFISILVCLIIAYIFYPNEANYTIWTHTLSYLGDYVRNPGGWYFLSIALLIAGFSFIILIQYTFIRVKPIFPKFATLGFIFFIIGSIGTILVGFFPDVYGDNFFQDVSMGKAHNIVALIAIYGLLLGEIVFGILFIFDHYPRFQRNANELYPEVITLPMFILLAIAGFGMLITQIIVDIKEMAWPYPGIYSFSLWEWILTFIFIHNIYLLALKLPEKIPNVEKK